MAGTIDLRVFDQDETWTDQSGKTWRLRDMTPRHRENLIRFLRRNASHFAVFYGLYDAARAGAHEALFGAPDDFDIPTVMDEYDQREWNMIQNGLPEEEVRKILDLAWMNGTVLMRALVSMVPPKRRRLLEVA